MQPINSTTDLQDAIAALETRQAVEAKILKTHFHHTVESLKPIHLIESAVHGVVTSSKIRQDVLTGSVSLAAGLVAKRIVKGKSHNPLRSVMGTVVELGVANMVAQNPKAVRTGFQLLKLFLSGSPARKARKPQGRDMGGI